MPTLDSAPKTPVTRPSSVASLRGTFKNGHTSEDVQRKLALASRLLGYTIVMTWAYCDAAGTGGDSQLMVLHGKGHFYEAPEYLSNFLYEENNSIDFEALKAEGLSRKGKYRGKDGWKQAEHPFNYTKKFYAGHAPK